MKEKILSRIPFIFTYYTLIILVTCTYNLLIGSTIIQIQWFLEVFACLVVYTVIDQIFDSIDFKSFWTYVLAQSLTAYALFLCAAYLFQWFAFTPKQLLLVTLLFVVIVTIGVTYMNYRRLLCVKELNDLIQKQ